MEYAIGNGLYDPYDDKWEDSEEARRVKEIAGQPCTGTHNPNCPQCKVVV